MARKLFLLIATIAVLLPMSLNAQRRPLAVQPLSRIEHEATAHRVRFDPVRQAMVEYAVEGKIELLPTSGNFLLSWNGVDGSRQEMLFEPPNKLSAIIAAEVSFDSQTQLYTYSYTISNLASSVQRLRSVYIGASEIANAIRPDETWYSRAFTPFLNTTFGTGGWAWSQVFATGGIGPGEAVSGFRLTSARPPGIVTSHIEGQRPTLRAAEDLPEELHVAIDRVYFRLPSGVTVGPASSDAGQTAEAQLEGLLVLLNEAERQGWLGTRASARNIRSSVLSIRASVIEAKLSRARQQVATLLRDLDAGQYEGILTEGRALMEFRLPLQLR